MKTSSISHECAVNLVGVLLQEMAALLAPTTQHAAKRHNLFTELACETCEGLGEVYHSDADLDGNGYIPCPDCSQHGFTIPTDCYCREGTGEDQGQELCLFCRGQQVRTEQPKDWSP